MKINDFIGQNRKNYTKLLNLADTVSHRRPRPNNTYDQVFMLAGDMVTQLEIMKHDIEGKDVVFLGDGDGMSMLFGLFAAEGLIAPPKSMTVLDFDERIANNIKRFADDFGFSDHFRFSVELYNVIDRVPEDHIGKYDYFYINPPYGSKNNGVSTETWLHRCMDLCTEKSSGCIVIPYVDEIPWTQTAMIYIQKFLLENGYVLRDMISNLHNYHHTDPKLKSATIVVDRVEHRVSAYSRKQYPKEMVTYLYGAPRPIPKYVYDDGTIKGDPDYDWTFGDDFWE